VSSRNLEDFLKSEVINAISCVEKHYEVLKDYLSGASYDLSDIKDSIIKINLKDCLSKAGISSQFYAKMKNMPLEFLSIIQDMMKCLDVASLGLGLGVDPRVWIELSIATYSVRLENIVQLLQLWKAVITR
jgi:intein-encoded DNA endonuclease-like protein